MVPSLLCTFVAHITFLHVFFLPPPFILSLSLAFSFSLSLFLSLSLYLCPLFLSVVARHMSSDALYQIFSFWSILLFLNLGIPWYMGCCKWPPNWIDEYTESTKAPSCKLTSMWETNHLQIIFLRFRHGCSTSKYGSSVHEFVQRFNSGYLGMPDFQTKPSILKHYIKLILSPIISQYISH